MVESWSEMAAYVKKLSDVVQKLPPPPQPDREWSESVNKLVRAVEGVEQLCTHYRQMEDEAL